MPSMKILLGYSAYPYPYSVQAAVEAWLARLRQAGIDVDGFCLTLDPPAGRLSWPQLEWLWRTGNKKLYRLYEDLALRLESYDVFVNYNGINLHPDFVRQLPTFNVYGCFDDPESSDDLSKPVAWAYDLAMVGNIAALELYRQWGVKEARFWPLGFRIDQYDPGLTRQRILEEDRDVDVTLICERVNAWRRERVDRFQAAFPQGAYYGLGWPNGFLPQEASVPLYQRTRIGVNIHNSTGPINYRTYTLPANGVLEICDNKTHLGQIFELNKEAVGYDTIEEAIDLCRYYLDHEVERREIAANGWERARCEYNEVAVFHRMLAAVEALRPAAPKTAPRPVEIVGRLERMRRPRWFIGLFAGAARRLAWLAQNPGAAVARLRRRLSGGKA